MREPFVASPSSSASGDDDERIAIACQESSLASMKAHHDKYDDLMMRERSEARLRPSSRKRLEQGALR